MLYLPRVQPDEPAEYQQMAAGPDRRWYRPIIALLIAVPIFLVLNLAVTVTPILTSNDPVNFTESLMQADTTDPVMLAILMLALIVLIPAVFAGAIFGMRMRIGYLLSVAGRLRWKWQFITLGIALGIYVIVYVPLFMLEDIPWNTPSNVLLLVALSVLLVPFQSAAEEIVFRGAIIQGIGSWIHNRWVALILATILSAGLFALAHGSLDPWILFELGFFATAAVFLTWYTGGLEAAIALHAGNNVVIFIIESIRGSSESLITEDTESSFFSAGLSSLIVLVVTLVLAFTSKKLGVQRRHDPAKRPQPDINYLALRLAKGEYIPQYAPMYPEHVQARYINPGTTYGEEAAASAYDYAPGTGYLGQSYSHPDQQAAYKPRHATPEDSKPDSESQ